MRISDWSSDVCSSDLLEEAQAQLLEQEDRLPGLDEQRRQAQARAQEESQAVSRLDARLAALSKLQDDVQKQGALEPWLAHHELNSLGRLWPKIGRAACRERVCQYV